MNRERLKILRDHLAGLPDERVDMSAYARRQSGDTLGKPGVIKNALQSCGTAACIAGWTIGKFGSSGEHYVEDNAAKTLGLNDDQQDALFFPKSYWQEGYWTRLDAIAAIDSMLASEDDDALPVWPEKAVSA